MAKIRVYELAKKMGVPANQLADQLRALGVEIKSNLSAVDESVVQNLGGGQVAKPDPPNPKAPALVPPPPPAKAAPATADAPPSGGARHPAVLQAKIRIPGPPDTSSPDSLPPATTTLPKPPGLLSAKPRLPLATEFPKPPGLLSAKPRMPITASAPPAEAPKLGTQGLTRPPVVLQAKPRVHAPAAPDAPASDQAEAPTPHRPPSVLQAKPRTHAPVAPETPERPPVPPQVPEAPEAPEVLDAIETPKVPEAPKHIEPAAAPEAKEHVPAPPAVTPEPEAVAAEPDHAAPREGSAHPPKVERVEAVPPPRPAAVEPQRPVAHPPQRSTDINVHRPSAVVTHRPGVSQPARPLRSQPPRPGSGTHPGRPAPSQSPQPRPGARPAAHPGRPGQPLPRPSGQPGAAPPAGPPRPPSRLQPPTDLRRKTKRERRMGKVQAREDRRSKLQDELDVAKTNAATGEAVFIREGISVKELADKISVKVKDIIAKLMMRGILATINQPLDAEVAIQLCSQFGFSAEIISYEDEVVLTQAESADEDKIPRAPVVTVMGHVDHGKSSLLEAIHDVDITSKESGGITQHIGAYKVTRGGRTYVFLDTPGHEAFTLMRARGAQVTDIVILVVAADDGVMPQTVEAINHCKAAGVPMVVAINKMDKPGANPDRVKQDLMAHGIVAEDFGGEVVTVNVSAKARQGIDSLLEMVSIVADMLVLRASPGQLASGTILESRLDRARGPVASVLIQDGTLKVGNLFLCGATYGHVRGLFDDRGHRVESAGPSTPVEVLGFSEVPAVGALYQVMEDEAKARQVASFRKEQEKQKSLRTTKIRLDNVFGAIQQGELKELALIVKADVHGSLEALNGQIQNLPQDQIRTRVVHQGVGAISESDILLASASNALVIGFNVRPDKKATDLSKSESVEVLTFTVIYDLVDQLKLALTGMLKPIEREVILGHAEVKEVYRIGKVGTVAGCIAMDGRILRTAHARILRDNIVVHTGKFSSLRRFKDDVSEVREGSECGIGVDNYQDIKPGDILEAFEIQMEDRKL